MPNFFPPAPAYPSGYDSDSTLFLVYNTAETVTTAECPAWAEEISIKPVGANDNEIWADNGFANINGELFYYDAVDKDANGKVNKLRRCCRNLGGTDTINNPAGAEVRGFVIAEHHNQLVKSILKMQDFIGINFDEDTETLDWRIRNLQNLDIIFDDFACPDVTFDFLIIENNPATGIVARYDITIQGIFTSYRLDFGDGEYTTTSTTGTHRYAPNATIDPILTLSNAKCTVIQTPIERETVTEPQSPATPTEFTVPVPQVPALPVINIPSIGTPSIVPQLPPIVFPCLDIGPIGPINIPSIISVIPEISIPSLVVISTPFSLPSLITVTVPSINIPSSITVPSINIPSLIRIVPSLTIPSTISITPVSIPPISITPVSIPPISITPISIPPISIPPISIPPVTITPFSIPPVTITPFSIPPVTITPITIPPITITPITIPPITITPITIPPIQIIGPDIPSLIVITPVYIPDYIEISPVSIPTFISITPISIPTRISITPVSIPSLITITPVNIPSMISFGPAPSFAPISFGPAPTFPSMISFGPAPSFAPISFGPAPTFPTQINFGPAPSFQPISFGPAPSFAPIGFDSPPTISVAWGTPPTVNCVVTVQCPSNSPFYQPNKLFSEDEAFNPVEPMEVQVTDLGIPTEIRVKVPEIPDITVLHDIPKMIRVDVPSIPDIKILAPETPLPSVININADSVPSSIELVATNLPTAIKLDASSLPSSIKLEVPSMFPDIKIDASGIPSEIQVVGIPSTIELVGAPSEIKLVLPEKPEIELVYKGAPIDVKINLDVSRLTGEGGDGQCVMIVPCNKS